MTLPREAIAAIAHLIDTLDAAGVETWRRRMRRNPPLWPGEADYLERRRLALLNPNKV